MKKPSSALPRSVRVYVEGGGSSEREQKQLREGFAQLFAKALGARSKPTVVACGGRDQTYKDFLRALDRHPDALCLLLVDSEGPVIKDVAPWAHVQGRVGDTHWTKPARASDEHLHFMVQAMEAWFFADPEALAQFYGKGFQASALPERKDVEKIPKHDLARSLEHASRNTLKGRYSKSHGFTLIGLIDPAKVRAVSPYAARFVDHLLAVCPLR